MAAEKLSVLKRYVQAVPYLRFLIPLPLLSIWLIFVSLWMLL